MSKFLLFFFVFLTNSYSQISGCIDKFASNYDPKATVNDCKCWYSSARIQPSFTAKLSDSITGTSGLLSFDGLLWTHNDHFQPLFYGLDQKGNIKKKVTIPKLKCEDWEDVSQDSTYIYIGDFGNNYSGNRKDLRILRIQKESFYSNSPLIDTIAFSYPDQKDFSAKKPHSTDFDCEAFVVVRDHIYLFTKQWKKEKTTIYSLPKTPGKHIAKPKITIDVDGLITGATTLPSQKSVVLCGYSKMLQPFLILLYDYQNDDICAGNKRKIKLALPFHQIEAITTEDGKLFYLTNEATLRKPFVNTPQQIHSIDLSHYLRP
ncbi:T9SS C-terminal target domain-containing protein [Flavobacterium adhaerens]|uniref:T9SS C-terminal target domain-containing protein n=1 Tax=Flavobacterium adhaerens TaxID=3149043 RepID=UPI0032B4A671